MKATVEGLGWRSYTAALRALVEILQGRSEEEMRLTLDVIAIGRCSVDLYGQQIGSRLEDIATFAKSVGGSPANMAIGAARLGLKSALITRVGDEQMGRFICEQMRREGVALEGIKTDPQRLTALVLLAVEDEGVSPHIFYRTDCADMALAEDDIDEAFIASAGAVVVTGTHFSRPNSDAAQRKAMRIAQGGRPQGRVRHRLPAQPLGPGRPCRRLRALRQVGPGFSKTQERCWPIAI